MFNQQSTITTASTATTASSINTAQQPQPRTLHVPRSSPCGACRAGSSPCPSKLIHLDATRQYLGHAYSESYLLDISRRAIMLHSRNPNDGDCEQKYIDGVIYHQIFWNDLYFVLSQSFDTVLIISRHALKALPVDAQPQPNQFNILHHAEDTKEYEQYPPLTPRTLDKIVDKIVDVDAEESKESAMKKHRELWSGNPDEEALATVKAFIEAEAEEKEKAALGGVSKVQSEEEEAKEQDDKLRFEWMVSVELVDDGNAVSVIVGENSNTMSVGGCFWIETYAVNSPPFGDAEDLAKFKKYVDAHGNTDLGQQSPKMTKVGDNETLEVVLGGVTLELKFVD